MKFKDLIRSGYSAWVNNSIVRVMKIMVLLMTTFLLQVSAAGFAQKVSFSKKDASLKELFTEIRKQTGFNVFWQEGKVNDALKFDASFNNTSLEEVLNKTLLPQNLNYKIVNQTVVVTKKDKPLVEKITDFFSAISIEGKVTDAETGKPIPGVTITLKGSTRSVVADDKGYFKFNGVPDNASLEFSSIGYKTITVSASGETMIIRLTPVAQTLQDVVVSTGYQTLKKASATGSYAVITAKDIESTPAVNLMERLEGKVSGVKFDVRNNKIQIRGISAYSAVPPLVIIDGFPATNQKLTTISTGVVDASLSFDNQPATSGNAIISSFNPADIESITFLKDAAASAIWGARAANGVIVITTKRGKKGTSSINFNTTFSTSGAPNFSNLTSMNSAQYIDLEQELVNKGFVSDPITAGYRSMPVTEAEQWMLKAKMNPIYTAQRDSALSVLSGRSNTDQLKDYLLQHAVSQQYNLSFSGGGENSTYYVSGNYTKDRPIFKNNLSEKYSILSNLSNEFLNKRLTLNTSLNYTYSKSQVNGAALDALGNGSFGLTPYDRLVDDNGNKIYRGVAFTTRVSDSLTRVRNLLPWTYNAIDELNYNNTISTNNNIRINTSLVGKVTDWLNVSVSGQYERIFEQQNQLLNQDSYYTRDMINNGTNDANKAIFGTVYGFPKGGIYKTARVDRDGYSVRAQFDVNKDFGTDHHFDMIGGTEIRQAKAVSNSQILYGYNEDLSTYANVNTTGSGTTGKYTTLFGSTLSLTAAPLIFYKTPNRFLSYYSTANYTYLGKYSISGSLRFDDVNIVGASRKARATPLWSTGLRWDIKKESFMDNISWIDALSLRGTYGLAGNTPSGSANVATITVGATDSYTQLPVTNIGAAVNQDLSWEITKTTNLGLDGSFFKGRLSTGLEVYNKRTTNLLILLPINTAYGFSSLSYNAGTLSGKGMELNVTGDIIKRRYWTWTSNFNFSYNTNNVTQSTYPAVLATVGNVLTTGYPVDNLFVYRWAGLDKTGQSQIYAADGSIIPSSANTVKPEDRVYAGRTTAPYFGGLTSTVRYKQLSLSARATYYLGNKFLYQSINSASYPTGGSFSGKIATSEALVNRWRNPGDEATTDVPGLTGISLNSLSRYLYSDLNVRDGGNIRLQQISLTYSVPKTSLKSMPFIKALNIGATVSNLGLLWTANKEGIDPDYQMTSTYTNLPPTRNYVLNLNLSL